MVAVSHFLWFAVFVAVCALNTAFAVGGLAGVNAGLAVVAAFVALHELGEIPTEAES